jgi:hypothetical protein
MVPTRETAVSTRKKRETTRKWNSTGSVATGQCDKPGCSPKIVQWQRAWIAESYCNLLSPFSGILQIFPRTLLSPKVLRDTYSATMDERRSLAEIRDLVTQIQTAQRTDARKLTYRRRQANLKPLMPYVRRLQYYAIKIEMVQAISTDSHVEQSFQYVEGIMPWQYVGVCRIGVCRCCRRLAVAAFDVSHISR